MQSIPDLDTKPLMLIPKWKGLSDDEVVQVKHFSLQHIFEELISSGYSTGRVYFDIYYDYNFVEMGEVVYEIPQDGSSNMTEEVSCISNNMHDVIVSGEDIVENFEETEYEFKDSQNQGYQSSNWSTTSLTPPSILKYRYQSTGVFNVDIDLKIKGLGLYQKICFENIDKGDFYANVEGRTNESGTLIFKPEDIINDILTSELKVPTSNIDYESFVSSDNYNSWKHAFTVNKKINSKKLIENIASASPYIPRFDHMGNFKFSIIPQEPTSSDITIKNDDVIDFSFSRTKIEDVYTKVEFKYNWDYAREEFNSSVESDVNDLLVNDDNSLKYHPEYYGFQMPDTLIYDHAETTLVIDDDRGKHIRDDLTAQDFCDWILLWHCNQHLKMKVRLPLKYMETEIGDMVEFDKLLGGIVPYGIDYVNAGNWEINGQQFYRYFMVSSTNKTLEYVEIECIQMHNLEGSCDADCNNVCGGVAYEDDCGQCVTEEIYYGECGCSDIPEGACDCDGNVLDSCGICGGDSVCLDCTGVPNGEAELDDCGDCLQSGSLDWNGACAGCMYFNEKTGQGADNYHPDLDYSCSMLNIPENYSPYGCCIWENPTIENSVAIVQRFTIETDHNYATIANDTIIFDDGIEHDKLNRHGNVGFDVDLRLSEALEGMELGFNIEILTSLHENVTSFIIQPLIGVPEFEDLSEVISQNSVSEGLIRYYDMVNPMIRLNRDLQTDEELSIWFQVKIETQGVNEDGEIFVDYHSEWFQIIIKVVGGQVGDLNADNGWTVNDIVMLTNCVQADNCDIYGDSADVNGDGAYNVLDIVSLVQIILNP